MENGEDLVQSVSSRLVARFRSNDASLNYFMMTIRLTTGSKCQTRSKPPRNLQLPVSLQEESFSYKEVSTPASNRSKKRAPR